MFQKEMLPKLSQPRDPFQTKFLSDMSFGFGAADLLSWLSEELQRPLETVLLHGPLGRQEAE